MAGEFDNPNICSDNTNDINKVLRAETEDIFGKELKADVSTVISSPVSIAYNNTNNADIPDAQWFDVYAKKLIATSSPIIAKYHKSEIDNVKNIINAILSIAKWVSFSTIALVAVFVFLDKDIGAIISAITGGVIDTVLGILIGLFNSTLKSKKSYFDSESDTAKFNKMLLLVQTISNQDKKDSVIEDILRKYFEVSKLKRPCDPNRYGLDARSFLYSEALYLALCQ